MELKLLENLREEDRLNLEKIALILKNRGLNVAITGGSLYSKDYSDIDLVTSPSMESDIGRDLSGAINEIKNILEAKVDGPVYTRQHDKDREDLLKGLIVDLPFSYVDSIISSRYFVSLGNSKFDISHSEAPFALNPDSYFIDL